MSTPPPLVGEAAALGAAVIWAGSTCVYRKHGAGISAYLLNLFKNAVALACLGVSVVAMRSTFPDDPRVVWLLVLSGVVGIAIGDTAFFGALSRLGAQATSTTQCLAIPFALVIAMVLLDETPSAWQLVGIGVTLLSVAGVVARRRGPQPWVEARGRVLVEGLVFAVVSAFAQAAGIVLQRDALQQSEVLPGTLLRFAPAVVILAAIGASRRARSRHRRRDRPPADPSRGPELRRRVLALATASFFGTFIGVVLLSVATKYAKAGVVAALSSTYPVWIIPVAVVFLKERADTWSVSFTLLAVAGVVMILVV